MLLTLFFYLFEVTVAGTETSRSLSEGDDIPRGVPLKLVVAARYEDSIAESASVVAALPGEFSGHDFCQPFRSQLVRF